MKDTDNQTNLNTHNDITPIWGLQSAITPRLGARLVQQGNHLHFLADRAGLVGTFDSDALQMLDTAFPVLIEQLEVRLRSDTVQHGISSNHSHSLNLLVLPAMMQAFCF